MILETRSAVVYVPGVFDLFHRGHAALLERARGFGGRVVVGVHTDAFASGYKRPPAQTESERARAVARLGGVAPEDVVLVGGEHGEVCARRGARILVHGDDWPVESYLSQIDYEASRRPVGVSGVLVPSTPEISTSSLISGGAPAALLGAGGRAVALDLDGTLVVNMEPREGAREFVDVVVELGARPVVVTNNNFFTPRYIRKMLVDSGFNKAVEVVSSLLVASEHFDVERVFVWGSAQARSWLEDSGVRVSGLGEADVILLLHRRDFSYRDLSDLCGAVKAGTPYVVGNIDATYPDAELTLPDTGSIASLVGRATGRPPRGVLGKPFSAFPAAFDARCVCAVVGDLQRTDGRLAEELGVPFVNVADGWRDATQLARAISAGRAGSIEA